MGRQFGAVNEILLRPEQLLFPSIADVAVAQGRRWPRRRMFQRVTKTFTEPRLCAAIVDRLTFNGAIEPRPAEWETIGRGQAETLVDLHLGGAHSISGAGRPARHQEGRAWGC